MGDNNMVRKLIRGLKLCECGCGQMIYSSDRKGRTRRFKRGHNGGMTGKKHSKESREKMKISRANEKHPLWKGDDIDYGPLHIWAHRHKPKPDKCEMCNERSPEDLASVNHVYSRDLSTWQWLCRKCHYASDGRKEYFEKHRPMLGKKHRPETIEKIKEKRKLQIMREYREYPKGSKHPWYGKHHTEESKEKIRKARKRYWNTLHSIPKL